jgi:hypothetical protein
MNYKAMPAGGISKRLQQLFLVTVGGQVRGYLGAFKPRV